jgi:hypothetical protein
MACPRKPPPEGWAALQFLGNIAYVWHGALHATTVAESHQNQGFGIRAQIVCPHQGTSMRSAAGRCAARGRRQKRER